MYHQEDFTIPQIFQIALFERRRLAKFRILLLRDVKKKFKWSFWREADWQILESCF
jgi:hypothetical protein